MTYTPVTDKGFREKKGSLSAKLATEFTAIETELNAQQKIAKGTLTAGLENAIAFAWQNPESTAVLVHRVIINVTTEGGTGSSVLDVGVVASATDTADTIFDGINLNTAAVYDSLDVASDGTNATEKAKVVAAKGGASDYITGKILAAAASALAGKYYIHYTVV